jgi:ribonuclease P protein component
MNNRLPESLKDFRFPAQIRLKGGKALQETIRQGRRISGGAIGLTYIKSESNHFGIGVTRGFGKAVGRNRIKRVVREYLRQNKERWPTNFNVFIRVFSNTRDEKQITGDLGLLLKQIK